MATITTDTGPWMAGLSGALKDFDAQAAQDVDATGNQVASTAQGLAPRLTGTLASSIEATPGRDAKGPFVDVGTSDPVGVYQEFGTSKMRAHPFMRPALAQARL